MDYAGYALLLLSAAGTACLLVAAARLFRFAPRSPAAIRADAVTILKPLHGAEPELLANLASFLDQNHDGPVQLVCGVQSASDPAIAVVQALREARPQADITLVVDPTIHGANAKISNLVNMAAKARHAVLIVSDSDMAVGRDYLARVTAALDAPGVGAVTCLYRGRGDAGGWSRLAAMGINAHFLPSVLLGTALGLASPCMGSTIALRARTLEAIGGFAAFSDRLADDYAIGAAVRARGEEVVLADLLLTHACAETSLKALLRQELRWSLTIQRLDKAGFAGSVVLHPFPTALVGAAFLGFTPLSLAAIGAALAARLTIALLVDRRAAARAAPLRWIPARDLLSFAVFVWTFFRGSVEWRGATFAVDAAGRLENRRDQTS
ncbi:glycosyltransferase [Hansschlegelia zhihuaiae]|uniref:Glycosyltransferase n=2 Tax=Hansschlegelia zhihuaiae TaxID=405005 RepID=A0A4Q0MAQ2_9HYPH|nr:glycosyltransferase [Hansschlegelia zhihuaiae]